MHRLLLAFALATPLAAQVQFAELGKRHVPPVRQWTRALVAADFDADGDLDVVAGARATPDRLYRNEGGGVFTDVAGALPGLATWTEVLATADVDGDGDHDLFVGMRSGSAGPQLNRLYLNDGRGRFTDATAQRLPRDTDDSSAAVFLDIDGDQDPDLVIGKRTPSSNRLFLNDGSGIFTDASAQMPAAPAGVFTLALADVDGDGDRDLFYGGRGGRLIPNQLYLNDGLGRFTEVTVTHLPANPDETHAARFFDADADGDLDLVTGNRGTARYGLNRLYANDGSGRFTDVTSTQFPSSTQSNGAIAVGDLDGDGDPDLVLANAVRNELLLNDGAGRFTSAAGALPREGEQTRSLVLADLDGDGDLDLLLGNDSAVKDRVLFNDGAGRFADGGQFRLDQLSRSSRIEFGDFDGDGAVDALDRDSLERNDGYGRFTADPFAPFGAVVTTAFQGLGVGDLDGDGDLDVAIAAGGFGSVLGWQNRLFVNDGTGRFLDRTGTHMPADVESCTDVEVADFDGDGDLDLAFSGSRALLYLNRGDGWFHDVSTARLPAGVVGTNALRSGDVDGDGDLDLVLAAGTAYLSGARNRLLTNDGGGSFTDATAGLPSVVDTTVGLALADVDLDGDLDLVFANGAPTANDRLLINDGSGRFADAGAGQWPVGSQEALSVAFVDVDVDGDPDVVLGRDLGDRYLVNDGSGGFTDRTGSQLLYESRYTSAIAVADVDGDGDEDFLLASDWRNRLYTNLATQLDAPFLLRIGEPYVLDLFAGPGASGALQVAVPFLGTRPARIPLPPLGVLGVDPASAFVLGSVVLPVPGGAGQLRVPVPRDPNLLGRVFYTQALVFSPTGPARLTNVVRDVAR